MSKENRDLLDIPSSSPWEIYEAEITTLLKSVSFDVGSPDHSVKEVLYSFLQIRGLRPREMISLVETASRRKLRLTMSTSLQCYS